MSDSKFPNSLFARINPYNPGAGYKTKRLLYKGYLYRVERGWCKVSKALGKELAEISANPYSYDSKPVFQVVTFEEAELIAREEMLAKDPRQLIEDAVIQEMRSATAVDSSATATATKAKPTVKKKKIKKAKTTKKKAVKKKSKKKKTA